MVMSRAKAIFIIVCWFLIILVAPFAIEALDTFSNKFYPILLSVMNLPVLIYFAITKKYQIKSIGCKEKIITPSLDKIIGALLFVPIGMYIYNYHWAFFYNTADSAQQLTSQTGTAFNRYAPPEGVKKIYCSQFDCINLIDANGDRHTIECAVFSDDGCGFISQSVFYKPPRYEHIPVQVKYLNSDGAKFLYEIRIADQFYDFDFFKKKIH